MAHIDVSRLSNHDLIIATKTAAANERHATVELVALLAEVDARELFLGEGCASLFAYCTHVLHLSEHAAYHRIEAARAVRRFPVILDRLASGELTLTAVGLLRKHFSDDNHVALLDRARHKSTRDVERLVAQLAPKPVIAPLVRRLPPVMPLRIVSAPEPTSTTTVAMAPPAQSSPAEAQTLVLEAAPADKATASSTSDDQYLLRLTISGETHAKLQRARDLLRHTIPNGDPVAIVDRALTVLVQQLERTKLATTSRPRSIRNATHGKRAGARSRHIPAAVRRTVWARDGGRCTFAGTEGRCVETGRLEFHHITPYARGGPTNVSNVTLRCRAHNAYEGRLEFGAPHRSSATPDVSNWRPDL